MPSGPNPILSATNTFIAVSNFAGYTGTGGDGAAVTMRATDWIPLGTVGNSTTGEIVAKVSVRETVTPSTPPTGGSFDSTFVRATGAGTVPASTTLGWSITAISGTVTVRGVALAVGATVGGGGYTGYSMASAVAYDASGGVAHVVYDEIV